jgi:hypothetical protein
MGVDHSMLPLFSRLLRLASASMLLLTAGCGVSTYQASRTAAFEIDGGREINDDDVRKAFEAKPQLGQNPVVAYYSFDPEKADEVEAMLKQVPGVGGTYRIPALMVTGQKRYDDQRSWGPPKEVSVKHLRLLAARAHADLLVLVDYGHKDGGANGWTALTPLLVPILFVPFLDSSVESYLETYVIDTRNGYLYGHLAAEAENGEHATTIYGKRQELHVKEGWATVLARTRERLADLIARETARPVAAAPQSAPANQAPPAAPHP